MNQYGLIGKNIDYSFSRRYFSEKFEREDLPCTYSNFDIQDISGFEQVLKKNPHLKGLNVTIPYKEEIIYYLDDIDSIAKTIGAVNVINIDLNQKLKGYNTDYFGFQQPLKNLFFPKKTALILGTGGASKAVAFALEHLGFSFHFVSRQNLGASFQYKDLDKEIIEEHLLIVNCTPLGTFPNIKEHPPLPYQFLSAHHTLYDLIYNPSETEFLKRGKSRGARIINGLPMLIAQAEKAWDIWNNSKKTKMP